MRKTLVALLLVVTLPSVSTAQESTSLDGQWTASRGRASGGEDRTSEVTISGDRGTWRDIARGGQARKNTCLDKTFPIAVQTSSADEVRIVVRASELVQGCNDYKLVVKRAGANALEGAMGNGEPVRLVRR